MHKYDIVESCKPPEGAKERQYNAASHQRLPIQISQDLKEKENYSGIM